MATERITVKPGAGFDPNNAAHLAAVLKNIADKTDHGTGWSMQSHDPDEGSITLTRQSAVTQVAKSTKSKDSYDVGLRAGTKPADGDQVAAQLESDPRHKGYIMTSFEPFLGQATLSKMTDDARRARGHLCVALGVKPWEVRVTPRADGGFSVVLPRTYVPSKHDGKLTEVAETLIGREGWFVDVNAQKLTAEIIPSDPPTFPGMVPYPFAQTVPALNPSDGKWAKIPLGVKLGQGSDPGEPLEIDLSAAAHGSIAGISNGGKSVAINALIYGLLARGFELCIVDVKHKSADFMYLKDLVRPGGWGCESIKGGVATLSLAIEEAERRAELIAEHGVQKWTELPTSLGIKPIAIVLDEVTALFLLEEVPKGLPKDHSMVTEAVQANLEKQILKKLVGRVAAEWRFAGLHIFLATQMAQNNTGVPPTIKINLGNKLLFGSNPNDAARGHAFSDSKAVPKVPLNIQNDSKANRGVAAAELEGQQAPCVFKAYFATTDDYRARLDALGVPTTSRPEPTAREISRFTPSLEEDLGGEPPSRMRPEVGGFGRKPQPRQEREDGLSGAAAAAHDLRVQAVQAAQADR